MGYSLPQPQAPAKRSGFMNALVPALGFLGGSYQAYAANPRAGGTAIPGIAGAANAWSGLQNAQAAQQQEYAKQMNAYTNQMNSGAMLANLLAGSDPNKAILQRGGLPGGPEQVASWRPIFENQAFASGPKINPVTGAVTYNAMAPAAQVQQERGSIFKRQGDIVDAEVTNPAIGGAVEQAWNRNYGQPQQTQPVQPGTYTDPSSGATMEPVEGTLQAGAQYVPQSQFPSNPFTVGVVDPGKMIDALKQGETARQNFETDARGVFANTETVRHNKADEGIRRSIFGATVKGLGGYGHAPQQMTAAGMADRYLTPEQKQQWLMQGGGQSNPYAQDVSRLNAIKSQNDVIDNALMDLGAFDPKTKGIKPEMMNNPQVKSLLSQKASLRNQMMGGGAPSQSGQPIKGAKGTYVIP